MRNAEARYKLHRLAGRVVDAGSGEKVLTVSKRIRAPGILLLRWTHVDHRIIESLRATASIDRRAPALPLRAGARGLEHARCCSLGQLHCSARWLNQSDGRADVFYLLLSAISALRSLFDHDTAGRADAAVDIVATSALRWRQPAASPDPACSLSTFPAIRAWRQVRHVDQNTHSCVDHSAAGHR